MHLRLAARVQITASPAAQQSGQGHPAYPAGTHPHALTTAQTGGVAEGPLALQGAGESPP